MITIRTNRNGFLFPKLDQGLLPVDRDRTPLPRAMRRFLAHFNRTIMTSKSPEERKEFQAARLAARAAKRAA